MYHCTAPYIYVQNFPNGGEKNFANQLTQLHECRTLRSMTTDTLDTAAAPKLTLPAEAQPERRIRMNLQLRESTHLAIKIYCAQRHISMQRALEAMLDKAFAGSPK